MIVDTLFHCLLALLRALFDRLVTHWASVIPLAIPECHLKVLGTSVEIPFALVAPTNWLPRAEVPLTGCHQALQPASYKLHLSLLRSPV